MDAEAVFIPSPEVPLECLTYFGPRPMEQDALIGGGNPENVTDLPGCATFNVFQGDHLTLAGRQRVDRLLNIR